jgi:murein DD-endopeptidase MepM/ murein hydrolase activator NlpD
MRRDTLVLLGLGSVGAALLLGRRGGSSSGRSIVLGPPVEVKGTPTVTPHGYFGAPRTGPPAHAHQGIDLAAPPGSHVLAVGDGVIVQTNPGLGKIVRKLRLDVRGAWDLYHRRVDAVVYADLGKPLVQPGDRVRKGDPIALVWEHGFVHFAVKEFRPGGEIFFDPKEAGFLYRLSSTGPEVA